MSTFEDYYNEVAVTYDTERRPDGADVEAAMIQFYAGKPLQDLHVLDAGCGTGNYAKMFLEHGFGKVTLLDASEGMLDLARAKLAEEIKAGRVVSVTQASLPEIPFDDATFDAVVFNVVLHHLSSNPDGTTFLEIDQSIAEARRVVKPGGVVVIMTCLPPIIKYGYWYTRLNEAILNRNIKRFPTVPMFEEMLKKSKFEILNLMNVFLTGMRRIYRNPDGPLHKKWRDLISFWKDGTEEEIEDVVNKVKKMKEDGVMEQYVKDNDKLEETGCFTVIFARAV